jgi:hypothetical protein
MKPLTPQVWAGTLLVGHALIVLVSWFIFMYLTSAVDDRPLVRLLDQLASSEMSKHPLFTAPAAVMAWLSLMLAVPFFLQAARRRRVILVLAVLVTMHAVATLMFVGRAPFVYLVAVCLIAFRGYQSAPRTS